MSFCGAALLMLSAHWFPSGKEGQLPTGFGQASHCPLCRSFADPGVGLDLCPRTALMPEEPNPERVHRYSRTTYALTLGPRRSQSRADAVADEFPLKLCDRSEDSEYEATVGSGGIHSFVQADEVDTEGAELLQCKHELSQATRKAVISVHHDRIHKPLPADRHQLVEGWSSFA